MVNTHIIYRTERFINHRLLLCVSFNCISSVKLFKVVSELFSDHLPIELNLIFNTDTDSVRDTALPLLPKLKWVPGNEQQYKTNVRAMIHTIDPMADLDEVNFKLADIIYRAADYGLGTRGNNVRAVKKTAEGKQVQFDRECVAARSKVFKCLNLYRKYNLIMMKSEYVKSLSAYFSPQLVVAAKKN